MSLAHNTKKKLTTHEGLPHPTLPRSTSLAHTILSPLAEFSAPPLCAVPRSAFTLDANTKASFEEKLSHVEDASPNSAKLAAALFSRVDPTPHVPVDTQNKWLCEQQDTQDFLAAHPEVVAKVFAVLDKYKTKEVPRHEANGTDYWRRVTDTVKGDFDASRHHAEDSFFVMDFGRVIAQMAKFKKHLPQVHPYYAVKCNNSEPLIAMISALGGCFDCASAPEIDKVLTLGLATPDNIIFANPCKVAHMLRHAESVGVRWVTFDNEQELEKIRQHMPSAHAIIRIRTDDSAAVCQFSKKFGAKISETNHLLTRAKELGVAVVGVSFHVGSGNSDPNAYMGSIRNARKVFDEGNALGFEMKVLDLGGGLPGADPPVDPATGLPTEMSFEEIAACVRPVLDELFPGTSTTIIAEPGRYFACASYSLAVSVHSKRLVEHPGGVQENQLYINDGLYQSFNCILFDHAHPELHLLKPNEAAPAVVTTIWGPTCDSMDCLLKMTPFPEVRIGDWLFVPNFGAYTMAAGCPFNGFETTRFEFVCSLPLFEQCA